MALHELEHRHEAAEKGHRLLKRKRNALNVLFRDTPRRIKDLKARSGNQIKAASFSLAMAKKASGYTFQSMVIQNATKASFAVHEEITTAVGVTLPAFESRHKEKPVRTFTGLSHGGIQVSKTREMYIVALESLVKLASLQAKFMLLGEELKVTNRRVNAIEQVIVPRIDNTIRFVNDALSESEREDLFRLKNAKAQQAIRKQELLDARVKWGQRTHR